MAVYTQCSAEDIEAFLEDFNVGKLRMAKGIAEGVQNSNYLIETDQNRFILTLYEGSVNPDDLPYFHELTAHLANKKLVVPAAIPNKSGAVVNELCGRPACLIQFLSGISVSEPTPAHCTSVGAVLAQLHLAAADFPMTRRNDHSLPDWRLLAAKVSGQTDAIDPALGPLIEATLSQLATSWPTDLPCGAIHADLFPDNVLFSGTNISGLIDFYFACSDFYAYDLAVLINSWVFSADGHQFFADRCDALIQGYQSVRNLTPMEKKNFGVLCKGAALRFVLTRTHDWINTPATAFVTRKDPLAFVRRLRWFQKNDIAL
jgi:homoserine kinase type II